MYLREANLSNNKMKNYWFIVFLIFISPIILDAQIPLNYYQSTKGLTGADLKKKLNEIISGHLVISYQNTDEILSIIDRDPNDSERVILVYSRRSDLQSNCCSSGWNREHVWPNSYGIDKVGPAYSDIHALRPCDSNVNSSRGNKYFDESDPSSNSYRLIAHPEARLCSSDHNSWSPPESIKGDIARSLFYMDVRYEGLGNDPDLELTDKLNLINSSSSYMGSLSTLLIWHLMDPVSEDEISRNNLAYRYQKNRNPFVDNPKWVQSIWGNPLSLNIVKGKETIRLEWPSKPPRIFVESSNDLKIWREINDTNYLHDASVKFIEFPIQAQSYYRLKAR